ncbi:serine hydrolase [Actinomadura kijaniata]|uniref:CubicO group peptidase (Beta-lactamase class C family) n=1 Tax=Actinomadura namibiensis TaxID=182080 RepID=A0A7W3LIH3_ACTNM|nr:serine hydrolase domain-containing protein [Actinomadura namibiensis]MBA8948677.1 CubicO group peptidase (beta-lactamase class C family) [Actinomadura namibiensis]
MSSDLRSVLRARVDDGTVPGAVALVSRGGRTEAAAVGHADLAGDLPMARDSIFRIASLTKPITAAATMLLVDDGLLALPDPVDRWLPELAAPRVVRTPSSPVTDTVPAERPITVEDLLTFRAGYGFAADFTFPAAAALFETVQRNPLLPHDYPPPDEWTAALAKIPLLCRPGEAWLYQTCSDILGVLVARVAGRPFPEFLRERLFAPLGMDDTGFDVPAAELDRFTVLYGSGENGREVVDARDGRWTRPPAFPSGGSGLVSTADDLLAFHRMLLDEGAFRGRRVLSAASVRLMTTDHLTGTQRKEGEPFLEGQGWGFGGSVDVARIDPWNVPGRYGWVGGSGAAAHLVPATGTAAIVLTQQALTSPTPPPLLRDLWRYAA